MTSGFTKVTGGVRRRLICCISGLEKSGKTHTAFTAPGPVYHLDLDIGSEGVVDRFLKDKDVYSARYSYTKADGTAQWEETWIRLKTDFAQALKLAGEGTVVVDTFSEVYELIRLARFGKLEQVMPHRYAQVNSELRELVRQAYESDANVVFLQKLKPVYLNDKRTGDYEPSGFGDMPYLVQANLRTYRDKDGGFHLVVMDARQNMSLCGFDLEGDMCNFQFLLDMVFGG